MAKIGILRGFGKLAVITAGFLLPYVEEYIRTKQQIPALTDEISELAEENLKLEKENETLKQQILIAAVIGSASFAAFIALLIVSLIR